MRPQSRWARLRAQLLVWGFVPTVAILAGVAILTYLAYERVAQEEEIGRDRERIYLAANRLREELNKLADELFVLARTEAAHADDPFQQRAILEEARRRLSIFDGGVVLLDTFGRVRGSQPNRPEIFLADWSDRPYFRQLLGGGSVVFSDVIADGPEGTPVVVVAVPITSEDGEFLGALVGMFQLGQPTISALYASVIRLRVGERGSAYVVDGEGQVIYHPDPDQIGANLGADPVAHEVLAGEVGAVRERDRGGQDMIAAFAPVPGTPWGLITEEDWGAHASSSRNYGRFLLFLLVPAILLPAAGFALLARHRRAEAMERARIEEQLRVARVIQQTLLPHKAPNPPGWAIDGHYQPAQAVGGDFYDFLYFDDGRIGLIIGDVTDKGLPAALVMASTRSLLRSVAQEMRSPGQVLFQVNNLLQEDIPPKMFATCLYAILEPATGRLRFANAGHNLPYRAHPGNGPVAQLRARGMPLGLLPGMVYEEVETTVEPGECILLYSDGLVEAHNARREMFGNPRLAQFMLDCSNDCPNLIEHLLGELATFAGRGWQQEDDVTLVIVQRTAPRQRSLDLAVAPPGESTWRSLAQFSLPSEPGAEREVMRRVVGAVEELDLPGPCLDRIKTAVAEGASNAIEHGNRFRPELPVQVQVLASEAAVQVRITDCGSGPPETGPAMPDIDAKVAGLQSPRGWGLFLMEKMADQVHRIRGEGHFTVELFFYRERGNDDEQEPA